MATSFFDVNGIKVANIKNDSDIVAFGIGVISGSNYETPKIAGISHFIEHMFFKGTKTRNWKDISEQFAKLGANQNAYTSNNEVFYHFSCPKESFEKTTEIMLDMFFNSSFPEEEIEKERNVITEEKKMYDDDPSSYFYSKTSDKFFNWDKGHDTIGTFETIKNIKRQDLIDYTKEKYTLSNYIFVCCGNVNDKDLKRYLQKTVPNQHQFLNKGTKNTVNNEVWTKFVNNKNKIKFKIDKENIAQSQVMMITDSISASDPDSVYSQIVYRAIGGGMFSKLFIRIRQELGLCYSVGMSSYPLNYPKNIVASLYGATSPKNVNDFITESEKILLDVKKNGIDKNLFECSHMNFLSSVLRNTERSADKIGFLIAKYLVKNEKGIEDYISKIKKINYKKTNEVAQKILDCPYHWAVMNPKK